MSAVRGELTNLLERLRSYWRDQGAPIATLLQPGLTDAEMDAVISPIGLRLPEEARAWWGWHNGAVRTTSRDERLMTHLYEFLPLDEAVEQYCLIQQWLDKLGRNPWDPIWQKSWLPLAMTSSRPILVCDTDSSAHAGMPIYVVSWGDSEDAHLYPAAGSLREVVSCWLRAFSEEIWAYSATDQDWRFDFDRKQELFLGNRLI